MQHASAIQNQTGVFAGLYSDYVEANVEHFRRRIFSRTVRELENLSDEQLQDIGLPRDQIKRRAYDSVYHHQPLRQ